MSVAPDARQPVARIAEARASDASSPTAVRVRTRWDDCDHFGHVNNAAYVALVRAAHDRAGLPDGRLRALTIAYREPVGPEVTVDVDVAVIEAGAARRRIGYTLRVDGRPAAEAEAVWQVPGPAPDVASSPVALPMEDLPMEDLPPLARDIGGRPFRYGQVVRTYQVGPDGAARPQVILQWLEHAVFRAAARAGWPVTRMAGASFLSLVIGHQLVLGAPAGESDELEITSRLVELRRVSGVWHHEVRRKDGTLVAADRARGAFLDLEGHIRSAPPEMLDDLLHGEPPT